MAKRRVRQIGPDLFDLLPAPRPRLGSKQLDAHCLVEAMGQTWRIRSIAESGLAYVRTRNGLGAADIRLRPPAVPARLKEILHAAAA